MYMLILNFPKEKKSQEKNYLYIKAKTIFQSFAQ